MKLHTKTSKVNETNWLNALIENNLESIMTVEINDAWLEIDIATPHEVVNAPFATDYVRFVSMRQPRVRLLS